MPHLHPVLLLALISAATVGPAHAQVTMAPAAGQPGEIVRLAPDVWVRRLSPSVWIHITMGIYRGAPVPSNGLLVTNDSSAVLLDTGWNPAQTERLLQWAQDSLHRPVRLAIVTHSHADRTGGITALQRAHIATLALPSTIERVTAAGGAGLTALPQLSSSPQHVAGLELYYPGPGHAPDNIIVFVAGDKILFGGCFIKAMEAEDLGNIGDADLARWPLSLSEVLSRYGAAEMVVPGHGETGGLELLHHTQALLDAERRASGGR
jgi:metallo-beta-lactamase class B